MYGFVDIVGIFKTNLFLARPMAFVCSAVIRGVARRSGLVLNVINLGQSMRIWVQSVQMADPVTFLASFPPIQSAIKVYGHANGMRIQLEIPESEMGKAVNILAWREMVLRVTIGPEKVDKWNLADDA